jgi:4-oxalocrotonate tautomerase
MPTLNLRITPLHNPQHYAELAQGLTVLTQRVLHKKPEVTVVMIDDLPAARFCIGGAAAQQAAACLEIAITAGSNTADEKEAFIAQAYALLERALGALNIASYVIVRELPAGDWGYGGVTQQRRRFQAQQQAQAQAQQMQVQVQANALAAA